MRKFLNSFAGFLPLGVLWLTPLLAGLLAVLYGALDGEAWLTLSSIRTLGQRLLFQSARTLSLIILALLAFWIVAGLYGGKLWADCLEPHGRLPVTAPSGLCHWAWLPDHTERFHCPGYRVACRVGGAAAVGNDPGSLWSFAGRRPCPERSAIPDLALSVPCWRGLTFHRS